MFRITEVDDVVGTDCDLSHQGGSNVFSEDSNEVAVGIIGIILIFVTTTYLT